MKKLIRRNQAPLVAANSENRAALTAQLVKEFAYNAGELGFDSWVRKIPWRRKWQPTPVFLPGEFHGQRSLVGYSPQGHKQLDMSEQTCSHATHTS